MCDGFRILTECEKVVSSVAASILHDIARQAFVQGADGYGGVPQTWLRETCLENITLPELFWKITANGCGRTTAKEFKGPAFFPSSGECHSDIVDQLCRGYRARFELIAIALAPGAATSITIRLLFIAFNPTDSGDHTVVNITHTVLRRKTVFHALAGPAPGSNLLPA
jgi:hypothetical protein